jgi:hypothetical protein
VSHRESGDMRENGNAGGNANMPDCIRLDGRIGVVTGAAGVIGIATMRLLAERGARIVAVDCSGTCKPQSPICRYRHKPLRLRPT